MRGLCVRAVMEALAARGVEFYLDDFGTGYSNLSSVVSLPLQYVKVDRSLLEAATNGGGGALLLRAVMETFRGMSLGVSGDHQFFVGADDQHLHAAAFAADVQDI